MHLRRSSRLFTSWLAVLAILMVTLAPSISQALGGKYGASWVEVCSTVGSKWVQADGGATEPAPASSDAHLLEHCPYCSLHANAIALPPAARGLTGAPALSHAVPTAFLAAPRTLHAWVSAQPRAPPSFS